MANAIHLFKIVGAAVLAIGACFALFWALPYAMPAAACSIAFSVMPE
jgi:hypothetical protein